MTHGYKIERTGFGDTRRVVDEAGNVKYLIMQYNTGSWAVHDALADTRIGGFAKTPSAALKSFMIKQSH